ncbi:MAG: 4Fe-4S dicluster domain-containing protein [Proteobacteria bacterium]|nr:4Fe-4S dicluster domain-containing protein [Pseudomonadota bacterium]
MYPKIQADICDNCGICAEICPSEVYHIGKEIAEIVFPEECIECGACVKQCPAECLALVED